VLLRDEVRLKFSTFLEVLKKSGFKLEVLEHRLRLFSWLTEGSEFTGEQVLD
jgi:hypothetical protein